MSKQTQAKSSNLLSAMPIAEIADTSQIVTLGKIGSVYGLQGWLKIQSYTDPLDNILDYQQCLVGLGDRWHQFTLTDGRLHGKGMVAHFAGFDTPEVARQLTNQLIGIERHRLPEPKAEEYYWHDLVGLSVINLNDECLGVVVELIDTGPHDILVIKKNGDSNDLMIPYVKDIFIKSVSLTEKKIIVDWQPDTFTYA